MWRPHFQSAFNTYFIAPEVHFRSWLEDIQFLIKVQWVQPVRSIDLPQHPPWLDSGPHAKGFILLTACFPTGPVERHGCKAQDPAQKERRLAGVLVNDWWIRSYDFIINKQRSRNPTRWIFSFVNVTNEPKTEQWARARGSGLFFIYKASSWIATAGPFFFLRFYVTEQYK